MDKPIPLTTEDYSKPVLHPVDRAYLVSATTGEGAIPITQKQIQEFLIGSLHNRMLFKQMIERLMTRKRAEYVRYLRHTHSWRALAQRCHDEWGAGWDPPSSQIAGIILCEVAAELLHDVIK